MYTKILSLYTECRLQQIDANRVEQATRKIPYQPEWLDSPEDSNIPTMTPRQIIINDQQLHKMLQELSSLIHKDFRNCRMLLGHTIHSKSPKEVSRKIVEEQRFNWDNIPLRPDGKSIYTRKIESRETHSHLPGRLNLEITGNFISGLLAEYLLEKLKDFLANGLSGIKRKPSTHNLKQEYVSETKLSLTAYLFDLLLIVCDVSGIDSADIKGEVLIKNQRGLGIFSVKHRLP